MKKQFLSTLALVALATALAPAAIAQNIAIVNGKAIPKERLEVFEQQYARSGRQGQPDPAQLRQDAIQMEIFLQEARARGLESSDDYKSQLDWVRQTTLVQQLFWDFRKKNVPTDAEMKVEYDKFVAANSGKEYHAFHILVDKEEQAKDIIARLKKGAKFDELAKKLSKDTGSGAKGGDLDWAGAGTFVKEFSDAMVGLAKGKTTETPVKTQFGYHVIRLEDTRDPQFPKFEEVKQQIGQQMLQQRMTKFQEDLLAKAKVE